MIDERLLSRIAELYYIHEVSQYQIAQKFNFSRSKVCRLIKEARNQKLIEFNIKKEAMRKIDLEKQIEKRFGLQEAIVCFEINSKKSDRNLIFKAVGSLGASYINRILKDGINIAVAGGKTLFHTFQEVKCRRKYKLDIFSTLGGISFSKAEYQNNDLIKMLCEKIGGTYHPIYLPIIFKNLKNKRILLEEDEIGDITRNYAKLDYHFAGVGPASKSSRYYPLGYFDLNFIEFLKSKNICGEIGLNFFDINGKFVKTGIEEKVVNLDIEKIKKIKNRVVIAFGKEKIIPLKGLLKSGVPTVCITDEYTAIEILRT